MIQKTKNKLKNNAERWISNVVVSSLELNCNKKHKFSHTQKIK